MAKKQDKERKLPYKLLARKYGLVVKYPKYGRDPLYWDVYMKGKLIARFRSAWEAEQYVIRAICFEELELTEENLYAESY